MDPALKRRWLKKQKMLQQIAVNELDGLDSARNNNIDDNFGAANPGET